MQNYGLQIPSDKIWADSTIKNTLKYLKTFLADLPNRPKYLGYLKKSSHLVSVVCAVNDRNVVKLKVKSSTV